MSKWMFLVAVLLMGCSDQNYQFHDDTYTDAEPETRHGTEPDCDTIAPMLPDGELPEACRPEPREKACEGEFCGAARNGCGGYYLCVVQPASECKGCALESHMLCPSTMPLGYRCSLNLLPIGCIDFGAGLWCCMDF